MQKKNESALTIDTLKSFVNSNNTYYISVWQIRLNSNETKKIKSVCEKYAYSNIKFDFGFCIKDDTVLYCSEFVAKVLIEANLNNYTPVPYKIILTEDIYRTFLNRESLIYYPVDFFEESKKFKKIYEWEYTKY
jgi:hypothetical protein